MAHQLIWENSGVLSVYSGKFDESIHNTGLNKLFGDPNIDHIQYIIGDYSQITGELLTEEDVDYPVAMTVGAASYLKNIKVALVARDQQIIELCQHFIQLFTSINASWEFKIFDNMQEARNWITANIKRL